MFTYLVMTLITDFNWLLPNL